MSDKLKRTPLNEAHRRAKARLVDFSGWEMPVNYGSQIEEHHAVRREAGVFDVSHMLNLDVAGPQARAFLRKLLANDVERLARPGQALYTCMLNPQGGVIDDLIVYGLEDGSWRLVLNAGCADKDLAWIERVARDYGDTVVLNPRRDQAMLAVQGPQARERLAQARPDWDETLEGLRRFSGTHVGDVFIARTGYTGEDGFEITLPAEAVEALWEDLLKAGVHPSGLGARDTLRLEAGLPLYGNEMDELVLPAEAGLQWTVCVRDAQRNFIGSRAVADLPAHGHLLGLKLKARGVMRSGMAVETAHGPGVVTSGTMSPTLGMSVGMARLPHDVKVGDEVSVMIRGQAVAAEVCPLPFVRDGEPVV